MRLHFQRRAIKRAFLALCATFFISALGASFANEKEMEIINARAKEIAPFLAEAPNFGARVVESRYWEKLAEASTARQTIKNAEKFLDEERPVITEELYKEFYRNGNRSNYQAAFFKAQSRFVNFALAECLERKGRFVKALDDEINFFCDLPSWVLPAHDTGGIVYDGKSTYSDLGSTIAAGELAIAVNLLGSQLDPKTVERATNEIERRVLAPYEKAVASDGTVPGVGMWWARGTNNWNAVCSAGTVAAALNVVKSRERRAFFIAATEYFNESKFLKGFTPDGYCSEGMGYWNYGFGYYIYLGAFVRNATDGKVDFFRFPEIKPVLDYAPNLEIDKRNYAVFADCAAGAQANSTYVGYLSRLKGYGYTEFEDRGLGDHFAVNDLIQTTSIGFDRDVTFAQNPAESKRYYPPIRTEFPNAGVVICRPDRSATGKYFAIAFKGGTNGEMHNHNDVGSYSILIGEKFGDESVPDVYVCRDPGGETYTARTFGPRRYEGQLLNSFGHPVPRINAGLQATGGGAKGVFVEKEFSDERDFVKIDMTSAYPKSGATKVLRSFEFKRAFGDDPGYVEIRDEIAFKAEETGTIETALITFEKNVEIATISDSELEIRASGAVVRVSAVDAEGKALKLTAEKQIVGENDDSVPNKPTRVALLIADKVQNATIIQRFEPDDAK